MKRIIVFGGLIILPFFLALNGCGSGGGGGGNSAVSTPQTVVTLSTTVNEGTTITSKQIKGIELYLDLPAGVSVRTNPDGSTPRGVVAGTGTANDPTYVSGTYPVTDPTSGSTNAVHIMIADVTGFDPGNFVTVTCDRPSGLLPSSADFHINGFVASQNGTYLNGLTCNATIVNQ